MGVKKLKQKRIRSPLREVSGKTLQVYFFIGKYFFYPKSGTE